MDEELLKNQQRDSQKQPLTHVQSVLTSNTNSARYASNVDGDGSFKNSVPMHQEIIDARVTDAAQQPGGVGDDLDMSTNTSFFLALVFLLNLPGLIVGYALGYQNQLTPCFEAKFGWADGFEKDIHNALLGSGLTLGMTIGAVSGGVLMQIGRRRSMFINMTIGLIGNLLTINIHSFTMILIGRFLFGIAAGLYSSIVPRMFAETIPTHLLPSMIASFNCAQNVAVLISFLLGLILPADTDTEALKKTNRWLVFYIYVPVTIQAIFLSSLFFIIKYEPIKFLIQADRTEEAILAVRQMYKYATDDEKAKLYINKIKSVSGSKSTNLTLKDALFNEQYRTATWVNIGYIIFHELTGINVINLYCNTIFKQMAQNGNAVLTPREGVYLVGIVSFFASLLSTQTVKYFGRKPLLIVGHLGIAVVHSGVALFNIAEVDLGVVVMVLVFIFIYQNSSGPVAWIYASETTIDAGMGICILTLWGTVTVLSIVCPIIMDPASLGPNTTFFILGGISIFGALYSAVMIKETKTLTDREKKLLFTPKKFLNGEMDMRGKLMD